MFLERCLRCSLRRVPVKSLSFQAHFLDDYKGKEGGVSGGSSLKEFNRSQYKRNVESDDPGSFEACGSLLQAKELIKGDLQELGEFMDKETDIGDPLLSKVCKYYLKKTGKQLRPVIVLLFSRLVNYVCSNEGKSTTRDQIKLAGIVEMIHTGSLLHDDVIDDASLRRMELSANCKYGNKISVLAGDFFLSRASVYLGDIRNYDVIKLISSSIANLVEGEVLQMMINVNAENLSSSRKSALSKKRFSDNPQLDALFNIYLEKSFLKTASLFSKSCMAISLLSGAPTPITECVASYAKNYGMAYQICDDVMDFIKSISNSKNAPGSDIKNGLATAPVLFAANERRELIPSILRGFSQPGDVETTIECILSSNAISKSENLVSEYCEKAKSSLLGFPHCKELVLLNGLAQDIGDKCCSAPGS